jgi:hypothetical protein
MMSGFLVILADNWTGNPNLSLCFQDSSLAQFSEQSLLCENKSKSCYQDSNCKTLLEYFHICNYNEGKKEDKPPFLSETTT